jgi:2-keto-4-pentenoate hydratase/2-oxohepta-3-ene-1,7-dioic acid hydratase in catechol pathway
VVCVGPNYMASFKAKGQEFPAEPVLFMKPPSAVIGSGADIVYPSMSEDVAFEAELAVVIGKRAKDVDQASALDYVLGYSCANDLSAKDLQKKDGQWTRGKSFDTFCPFGPAIATGLNPDSLAIKSRVNGEIKQDSNTSDMLFKAAWLISYISSVMTLEPFDVISTGTPPGAGSIKVGDVIEIEVEGVGVLKNKVIK